jgi:hypothetical protein
MAVKSIRVSYLVFWPVALGAILLLPAYVLAVTAPSDKSFAMPSPGRSAVVEVANNSYSDDKVVALDYDVVVDPVTTSQTPTDRPSVPCHFRLVAVQSGKRLAEADQLHYASEYYYGHMATFSSNLFEMPAGKTWVALTNEGCRKDYVWSGGLGKIGPTVREGLLVPIAASILQAIGLISIALGLVVGTVRFLNAWLRPRSELIAGERS